MRRALHSIRLATGLALRADWRLTVALAGLMMVASGATATLPLWMKLVADAAIAGDELGATSAAVALALAYLVGMFTALAQHLIAQKLIDAVSVRLDDEIMRMIIDVPTIEHHERPEYLDRVDVVRASREQLAAGAQTVLQLTGLGVRISVTVVVLSSVHPALLLLPAFALPALYTGPKSQRMQQQLLERLAQRYRLLGELRALASGGAEVRIFGLGDELVERQRTLHRELSRRRAAGQAKADAVSAAGALCFTFGYLAVILTVLRLAVMGRATAGDVLLAVGASGQLAGIVWQTMGYVGGTTALTSVVERYDWLRNYTAAATHHRATHPVPKVLSSGIKLDGVSFRYPDTNAVVLKDITLDLAPGTIVALVGENGAGKSTLIKLLCGFYTPSSGVITVDGIPLSELDHHEWRRGIAAAFQDFVNFELLLRQSVGVGDLVRADDEAAVINALTTSNASDLIEAVPDRLSTQLGLMWGGVELSGGQWQKIAIARARMREDPLLLVLDEPTAALDAHAEHALFEQYREASTRASAKTGAITVLVSHRFSTVRMADVIVVLDDGRIVETGDHAALMASEGPYAELYELQARAYRE